MPLHIGARLHTFVHELFASKDATETKTLYNKLAQLFASRQLGGEPERWYLSQALAVEVLRHFDQDETHPEHHGISKFIERLLDYEGVLILPEIDWAKKRSTSKWWALRDELIRQRHLLSDFDQTCNLIIGLTVHILKPLFEASPQLLGENRTDDGITISTPLIRNLGNVGGVIDAMMQPAFAEDVAEHGAFDRLKARLESNLVLASGGNPADPKSYSCAPKPAIKSDIADPSELVASYLGGTPLKNLFERTINFTIPTASRFEHHHIVAGSGHGKTQTLQYLIGQDLEAVAGGKRSVVVLDSQGDLIRNIANLAEFALGGPLHDRIVIIDPTDVEYPVSLNLFDVGMERLQAYPLLERERLTNSILELYDFVLGTLLDAQMTQKQNVIFRYVTRLMLHIPNATIHTLRELMEPGSDVKFAGDIAKLEGTAKHFFESEFSSREFEQTKKQVLRRLWGILENQTFERMFSHPKNKLDIFAEMNAGKVILINTAKDLLKEQGTEIFGRFFIAMIAQASQERAVLPSAKRTPTFVYIDEAQDYFDRNIGIILAQARKYNVGMVLAHQYLGQLEPKLQDAFGANTAIKFAGGVSNKDARVLAPMLHADAGMIEAQPKGSFATSIRGVTNSAVPLQFPFGWLEDKPRMSKSERDELQERMRERYAVHYQSLNQDDKPEEEIEKAGEVPDQVSGLEEKPQFSPKADKPKAKKKSKPKPATDFDTDAGDTW